MDVLAKRKTGGKIGGHILINGEKLTNRHKGYIGYVEQQDIHLPSQTVLEALEFSALVYELSYSFYICCLVQCSPVVFLQCRLPDSMTRSEKKQHARGLLQVLGLESYANTIIGTSSEDGISPDQRKRLTIGVELAAKPTILFLDEPTSGLDSFGAVRILALAEYILMMIKS